MRGITRHERQGGRLAEEGTLSRKILKGAREKPARYAVVPKKNKADKTGGFARWLM
jgi:hypothetical protein